MRCEPVRVRSGRPPCGERDAELRVELVDGAVGLDPRVRLRRRGSCRRGGSRRRRRGGYRCGSGSRSWLAFRNTMLAEPGRWSGKPVRIRRGPATVTGEATAGRRSSAAGHWAFGLGRRGTVGPEARRPSSDLQADRPSWKGVAHSMKLSITTGMAAGLLALAAAPALAAPATVDRARRRRDAHARRGDARHDRRRAPVSKAGARLLGDAARAARSTAATAGDWDADWFDGLGHFVSTIRGEAPAGDDYWSVVASTTGAATRRGVHARARKRATMSCSSSTAARFDGTGCSNAPVEPLALTAPATATAGGVTRGHGRQVRR